MDFNSFQRKAIIFIFISILAGAILLARKQPLKKDIDKKEGIKKTKQQIPVSPKSVKIDINTANLPQLTKLPGIGKTLAKQIIDYRKQHGSFKTLNDLLNVPGIGPSRLNRIKGQIALEEKREVQLSKKINLNTISPEQLATITGIGPRLAKAIVNYRIKNGPFSSIDELTKIPRIGKKTCSSLKEYLYVDPIPQNPSVAKKNSNTRKLSHEIDTSLSCPYCGKTLWEKGKKKRVYIRCPHCLKTVNEK